MDKLNEAEDGELNEQAEQPKEVKLGPRKVVLVTPDSLAVAIDICDLANRSKWRAYAAALGVCVPKLSRWLKVPDLGQCDYSMARFGGGILDGLKRKGCTLDEISVAGGQAFTLVASSIVTESEVKAAEGFSEVVEEGSTST